MPVWVQLTSDIHIEERGKLVAKQAGNWINVGKQYAQRLIAQGQAISPFPESAIVEEPPGSSGLMMFGAGQDLEIGIDVSTEGIWELRWEKTAFWSTDAPVKPIFFSVGFSLLDRWEIALPLFDYRHLAKDEEADPDELQYTQEIIRDLRVPLYDIRLMFVKRCESTRRLFEVWHSEGSRTRLSFLRSLYRTTPLVLALPTTWTGQWSPTMS